MNSVIVFDEPQLEFASGEMLEHPRDGLTLFGPVDSKGIEKPVAALLRNRWNKERRWRVSRVCKGDQPTASNRQEFGRGSLATLPGFRGGDRTHVPTEPAWVEELDELVVQDRQQAILTTRPAG